MKIRGNSDVNALERSIRLIGWIQMPPIEIDSGGYLRVAAKSRSETRIRWSASNFVVRDRRDFAI